MNIKTKTAVIRSLALCSTVLLYSGNQSCAMFRMGQRATARAAMHAFRRPAQPKVNSGPFARLNLNASFPTMHVNPMHPRASICMDTMQAGINLDNYYIEMPPPQRENDNPDKTVYRFIGTQDRIVTVAYLLLKNGTQRAFLLENSNEETPDDHVTRLSLLLSKVKGDNDHRAIARILMIFNIPGSFVKNEQTGKDVFYPDKFFEPTSDEMVQASPFDWLAKAALKKFPGNHIEYIYSLNAFETPLGSPDIQHFYEIFLSGTNPGFSYFNSRHEPIKYYFLHQLTN